MLKINLAYKSLNVKYLCNKITMALVILNWN